MRYLLLFTIFLITPRQINSQEITSPDNKLKLTIKLSENGELFYNLMIEGLQVIKDSKLGIDLLYQADLIQGFEITDINNSAFSEEWKPVWGEVDKILNNYNQMQLTLNQQKEKRTIVITFRVFNDGIGFRYEFPKQENLNYFTVLEENTEFNLTGDHKTFWIPGDYDSQEYVYTTSLLSEINSNIGNTVDEIIVKSIPGNNIVQTPLMLKSKEGLYINIHEAALLNYPVMYLTIDKDNFSLKSHLCPDALNNKAYLQAPCTTPWRTIIVSNKAEDILSSKIILNLNEPTKFEDVSWIKPIKYIGIWWGMHVGTMSWNYSNLNNVKLDDVDWKSLTPNGVHGATTENTKRYIDFAARHGFDAVLVEGWNVGWEDWFGKLKEQVLDFVTPYPDFDVIELQNYAESKNVELIMHHETSGYVTNYERRLDDAFTFMKDHGYNSVKTGYVGKIIPHGEHHDGQWMVNHFTRVLEKAEKYKICVNSHESVRSTGLHRTYPNWLAAEAARGNEFNAWSIGNPPEHETILPFTRFIGGPMDYTPGIFQIKMDYYKPGSKFQVHTTLEKQLALYVTIYSPIQMAADLPENYERFPDAFSFIEQVPVNWSDTKILKAEPGDYIIIARKDKNSDNWFVGAITDEEARSFEIKLDFLDADRYEMTTFKDAKDSDWEKNPMKYEIEKSTIKKNQTIKLNLASGGGTAIILKPTS
ncbi:MAG: glycoside hydrolase family 97 protein [Ignavibacteriaceae bacterium]|nr:glycoside hydrolase family 97 protein [Ignavibacteriaceae bacterium]HRN25966.1 glycoside hydrolase family 97 protein [Ignavibacteriaceae bacterium]